MSNKMYFQQLNSTKNLNEIYETSINLLPLRPKSHVLDLSCELGLELELYFKRNDTALIDVIYSSKNNVESNFKDDHHNFIISDLFSYEYEMHKYEAAISVGLMQNFPSQNKIDLYKKIYKSLKREGYFILVDVFASNNQNSSLSTLDNEIDCLHRAGFRVCVIQSWGQTSCLKCTKF